MQMRQKQKKQKLELFFTPQSFDIGLFFDMRPNFQSLFSNLDIFYPSMLAKPKGIQITACNLNEIFPSGWGIMKNLPQKTQSIANIPSRFFCYLYKSGQHANYNFQYMLEELLNIFSKSGSSSPLHF